MPNRPITLALACAASVATAACGAVGHDDGRLTLATHSGVLELDGSARTMLDTRYDTVVRQQYDFSCGSAALATLLTYHYGMPRTETSVFEGMWDNGDRDAIERLGFSLLDMKRYLAARDIDANGYRVDLDQIAQAKTPGIALIAPDGYRHFVVVKGLDEDFVLVGHPALGLRRMERNAFEASWNGVYFVLSSAPKINHTGFNTTDQWSRVAAFAPAHASLEPLSQQALALTAVGYGEF